MKKIIFIITSIFISSCDLFTTRDAQPPEKPRSDYQTAFTPEILISNFINSLRDKDTENYLSCLSDPAFTDKIFAFLPSSEALAQFPALGNNWNKSNESQYMNNLKVKIPDELPITLILSNSSSSVHGDSITFVASYSLNVPLNETTIPTNYQGELIFELVRDSRFVWSIYFWQDIKRIDSPSWSELKGRFY
ncbi:MAG: hypothetical protein A2315_04395 [Ignavibacteria bacterium RIFOXYB2_FULL_35_12]|nr:MAG: hypothetical protein A2X60_05975 [Ignavibacteria bacterium GWF2_35_20]OGU81230.1 MAG: hypothetical protein A2254_12410 [Ignavibacteria bacterium RIFOXYA2_FULL_35_9]OGU86386.1 MAG: hypothetical protein A3K31_02210 [Ignavibacteria bacterium RIFOXYA12_FULL_35_25]OGU87768.1 MAG: hypothetical protein A2492_12395 [Ignavibacteria bacterium RIFOXYC12_FULL_35_11]OGU96378.1 MAG: hypothetical protein A2347_05430 [Ignavibacteria bacterium RIFOXYB12_FULL_35_14]OGV01546.1 MAG: hypothetical protein A